MHTLSAKLLMPVIDFGQKLPVAAIVIGPLSSET